MGTRGGWASEPDVGSIEDTPTPPGVWEPESDATGGMFSRSSARSTEGPEIQVGVLQERGGSRDALEGPG